MKPKTTLKFMKASRLASTHWRLGEIETTAQRDEMYRLLDEAGYYWSSQNLEWVKRRGEG